MNKKLLIFMLALSITLTNAASAFATNNNQDNKTMEKPEKPANEVIGKITEITSSKITVTLAERKEFKFDKDKKPEKTDKKSDSNSNNNEQPNFNPDDMFTLTNESKTYDISSAKFFSGMDFDKDRLKDSKENKDKNKDTKDKKDFNQKESTYSDFKVGEYVTIELESESSTVAKMIRKANAGPMRGFGKDPNKDFNKDNKKNKS